MSKIAILGCGNIGSALARGFVKSQQFSYKNIILTRRKLTALDWAVNDGYIVSNNNSSVVKKSKMVILATGPTQLSALVESIKSNLTDKHLIISVVSGVSIQDISSMVGKKINIVRVMPNTAAALCESISCIAGTSQGAIQKTMKLFENLGTTLIIDEEQMASATALGACGIAFFLRAIRAASQGGIEIGFHSDEAFTIASQTAKGASALLLSNDAHPESEIDKVTTPKGATISGLNEMEHRGFSSAFIKGITTSHQKIDKLLPDAD